MRVNDTLKDNKGILCQLSDKKFKYLNEMDKFLKGHEQPKHNQEELDKLNNKSVKEMCI